MFGLTEIEVYKNDKGRWQFRIVSGKNNTPRCASVKTYRDGYAAYAAAERFAKLLHKIDSDAPRFYNIPNNKK